MTTEPEMVERLARAIYEAKRLIEGVDSTWDEVKDRAARPDGYAYAKLAYEASTKAARAAIEAMMEPTPEMCAAGMEQGDGIGSMYRAMIAEALSHRGRRGVRGLRWPKAPAPRVMTRDDRRLIVAEIKGCWDDEKSRYMDGWHDERIAQSLGAHVPKAWVTEVREDYFGNRAERQ